MNDLRLGEDFTEVAVTVARTEWVPKRVATRIPPAGEHDEWRFEVDLATAGGLLVHAGVLRSPDSLSYARYRRSTASNATGFGIHYFPHSWNTSDLVQISFFLMRWTCRDERLKADPRALTRTSITTGDVLKTGHAYQIAALPEHDVQLEVVLLAKQDTEGTHGRWRLRPELTSALPPDYEFLSGGRQAGTVARADGPDRSP